MYCYKCGTEMSKEAVFCPSCGTKQISVDEKAADNGSGIAGKARAVIGNGVNNFENNAAKEVGQAFFEKDIIASIIGAVLMIIGVFLPLVTVMGETLNFMGGGELGEYMDGVGDGIILLILAVACLVFAFLKKRIVLMILDIITGLIGIIMTASDMVRMQEYMGSYVKVGFGTILIYIASAILIISAILVFLARRNAKKA